MSVKLEDKYLSRVQGDGRTLFYLPFIIQYCNMHRGLSASQHSSRKGSLKEQLSREKQQPKDPKISPLIDGQDISLGSVEKVKNMSKPTKSPLESPLDDLGGIQNHKLLKKSQKDIQVCQQIKDKSQCQHKQNSRQKRQKSSIANLALENEIQREIVIQDVQNGKLQVFESNSKVKRKTRKKQTKQKFYDYDLEDSSETPKPFKFPFINEYLYSHYDQYLKTLQIFSDTKKELERNEEITFNKCDVRFFNWACFVRQVGKFDVVVIDPPWRIKGAQQNDSQFMFANSKFSLQYNTMANSEIQRIPLHLLSDQGFMFLWILNSQLESSLKIMETWGYELVEQIVWVKLKNEKICLTHGYYMMHSYEVCLVGYKCGKQKDKKQQLKLMQGLSWNAIFSEVRQKSRKPDDLYNLIDMMFKGGRKIEIFARNHNLRFGFFSLGNQLSQSYNKYKLTLTCDGCQKELDFGSKRYKSKLKPNHDLCQKCAQQQDKTQFFELVNLVGEDIRHQFVSCNHCGIQPIWGIRFRCNVCLDFDICENCYDKNLDPQHNFHQLDHQIDLAQVPVFGNGFSVHEVKCVACHQKPIIGIYFSCMTCKGFNLCQKCYFQRPSNPRSILMKKHKKDHQVEAIFEPQLQPKKQYQCFGCQTKVLENCWMCQNCYNFFFCQKCYQNRTLFKSSLANSHKIYHTLSKIF